MSATIADAEFPAALRSWRSRRRMSQLELAIEAGTTQRHLSYIETGRSRPGRGMVLRLAEALGLPLRERNSLLLSAGFAPTFGEAPLDAPELATIVGARRLGRRRRPANPQRSSRGGSPRCSRSDSATTEGW